MNSITALNPFSTESGYATADSRSYNAARVSQTAVAGEQSTDITIITDQKDRVTLSFDADFTAPVLRPRTGCGNIVFISEYLIHISTALMLHSL